jgi:hypothetical protein
MKLLATVQVPTRSRRRNWRPGTPRLTLRGRAAAVELVVDAGRATWTRTLTVSSAADLLEALAIDIDRLGESIWGLSR